MSARRIFLSFVSLIAAACGEEATFTQVGGDDHVVSLDGEEILAGLDADGLSPVIEAPHAFVRLGIFWEAGEFEMRSRDELGVWSPWAKPVHTFAEEGLHAGYFDPPASATAYQYRVGGSQLPPVHLSFEPLDVLFEEGGEPYSEDMEYGESGAGLGGIQISSRGSWSLRPPKCVSFSAPFRAVVHHTAGSNSDTVSAEATLRGIQSFHMDVRGWCDIAYNYLVSRDGRLWEGRGATHTGGHTFNENTGNVALCFIGNYQIAQPPEAMICSAKNFFQWLHGKFPAVALNRDDVKGHRQFGASGGATSCPGEFVYRRLGEIVTDAGKGGCNTAPGEPSLSDAAREALTQVHLFDPVASSDINGDGKADVCARNARSITCYLSNGAAITQHLDGPDLENPGWMQRGNWSTLRLADIDGDGKADVCGRADSGFKCWRSLGDRFGAEIKSGLLENANGWDEIHRYSTLRMADVNGDGKADFCARTGAGFRCWKYQDRGWSSAIEGPEWSDDKGWKDVANYGTIRMGDVNGDGKHDVCARNNDQIVCFLSSGAGFPDKVLGPEWREANWKSTDHWSTIRLEDINGDGRADICGRRDEGYQCHLSHGDSFGPPIRVDALTNGGGWTARDQYSTLRLGDVDGDGDRDLCGRNDSGMKCWIWQDRGWARSFQSDKLRSENGWDESRKYHGIRLADVNGDGKADLCARYPAEGLRCFLSTGDSFNGGAVNGPEWTDERGWDAAAYHQTIRIN